jgi:hypothetical protein
LRGTSGGASMTIEEPDRFWYPYPPPTGLFLCMYLAPSIGCVHKIVRAGGFGLRPLYCPWPRSLGILLGAALASRLAALRGTSDGATMTTPGGRAQHYVTDSCNIFYVLGAPASIIGSEFFLFLLAPALRCSFA